MEDINKHTPSTPTKGMNLDNITSQIVEGFYSLLYNGINQSTEHKYSVSNEVSTVKMVSFKEGYYCIGGGRLTDNLILVMLVNPTENKSEIGYFTVQLPFDIDSKIKDSQIISLEKTIEYLESNKTTYTPLVYSTKKNAYGYETSDYYSNIDPFLEPDDIVQPTKSANVVCNALMFNINYPIRNIVVKRNLYKTYVFFTDGLNEPRYLILRDISSIPYVDESQRLSLGQCESKVILNELDIQKINIFANNKQPIIDIIEISENGSIPVGTVQFGIRYVNNIGEPLSQVYNITTPVTIIKDSLSKAYESIEGSPIQLYSTKAVKLNIKNIDSKYDYYQLLIIESVNGAKNYYAQGPISTEQTSILYTGNEQIKQKISIDEFYQIRPNIQAADKLVEVDNRLMLQNITETVEPNLQRVTNNVKLSWTATAIPTGITSKSYKDGVFSANHRGYMGGEVYPFSLSYVYDDGYESPRYHIPGRSLNELTDLKEDLSINDFPNDSNCIKDSYPYWKLYDTSTVKETKDWQNIKNGDLLDLIGTFTDTQKAEGTLEMIPFQNDIYIQYTGTLPSHNEFLSIQLFNNVAKQFDVVSFIFKSTLSTNNTKFSINKKATFYKFGLFSYYEVLIGSTTDETAINLGEAIGLYNELNSNYKQSTYNTYNQISGELYASMVLKGDDSNYIRFVDNTSCASFVAISNLSYSCAAFSNQQLYIDNQVLTNQIVFSIPTLDESIVKSKTVNSSSTFTDKTSTITLKDGDNNPITDITIFTGYYFIISNWVLEYNTAVPSVMLLIKYLECNDLVAYEGDFSYWESIETYPCDKEVWGELAGKPIRHHKFPERYTIPHFQNIKDISNKYNDLDYVFIHPFSVKLDHKSVLQSIKDCVKEGIISQKDASRIVGYKLYRGNRVNDASVIAKGLLYDVWEHTKYLSSTTYQKFFYQNYPFNDLNPDPFILNGNAHMTSLTDSQSKDYVLNKANWMKPLNNGLSNDRFTFLSPDTSFYNIPLQGRLHVDMEVYGKAKGHYYPVFDHAKYRRLRNRAIYGSWGIAGVLATLDNLTIGTTVNIKAGQIIPETIQIQNDIQKLLELGTSLKQYVYQYNGVGDYNRTYLNPIKGQLWRDIEIATYLDRDITNVGDIHQFNNFNRESSVYLKLSDKIKSTTKEDNSRYKASDLNIELEDFTSRDIASYYVSVKRSLPDQYGQIHTVDYCYTDGFWTFDKARFQTANIITDNLVNMIVYNRKSYNDSIFGGDTFITKFAAIRSHNYFIDNRKGFTNDTGQGVDVNYSQLSNVGYPSYYFDTEFTGFTKNNEINPQQADIYDAYAEEQTNDLNSTTTTGDNVQTSGLRKTFSKMKLAIKSMLTSLINPAKEVLDNDTDDNETGQTGVMYLSSNGIPYFYVESVINTELRYSGEDYTEDFYPHVTKQVPDNFLVRKPTSKDNVFLYNRDFSNQNVDNASFNMSLNYSPKDNRKYFGNRLVWSQKGNMEETLSNYLLFRVNDYKDFNTDITTVGDVSGGKTIITFPNRSMVFNAYSTIDSNNNTKALYFGTGDLLENGQSLVDSITGYGGSQVSCFLSCEVGSFWIDNVRGAIFSFTDTLSEISLSNKEWFRKYLPFQITKYFDCYSDNPYHYNKIGMTIGYDNKFNRVFFTKFDYIPLNKNIVYDSIQKKFFLNNKEVFLNDTTLFRNVSFTISYDAHMKEWSSFHSYQPSMFVHNQDKFISIVNNKVYMHNAQDKSYQIVYGKLEPYVLDTPTFTGNTDMVIYFESYTTVFEKTTKGIIEQFDKFFNKAVVYNKYQTTGLLNLIYKDETDDDLAIHYPFKKIDSTDILYSNKDNIFTFNYIWNIVKNNREIWVPNNDNLILRNLNLTEKDYMIDQDNMDRIRGKESFVRLIQDKTDKYQFITVFNVNHSQPSIY